MEPIFEQVSSEALTEAQEDYLKPFDEQLVLFLSEAGQTPPKPHL